MSEQLGFSAFAATGSPCFKIGAASADGQRVSLSLEMDEDH